MKTGRNEDGVEDKVGLGSIWTRGVQERVGAVTRSLGAKWRLSSTSDVSPPHKAKLPRGLA